MHIYSEGNLTFGVSYQISVYKVESSTEVYPQSPGSQFSKVYFSVKMHRIMLLAERGEIVYSPPCILLLLNLLKNSGTSSE